MISMHMLTYMYMVMHMLMYMYMYMVMHMLTYSVCRLSYGRVDQVSYTELFIHLGQHASLESVEVGR